MKNSDKPDEQDEQDEPDEPDEPDSRDRLWIPEVLRTGFGGSAVKVWTFLYLNQPRWFTAQEIAQNLGMPLRTAQGALRALSHLPRILCQEEQREGKGRGRRLKIYSFQTILPYGPHHKRWTGQSEVQ